MTRKGSTEMWWIIIGAVIALIVLIILMLLFTKQSNTLVGGISECEGKGGVCAVQSTTTDPTCPSNTLQTSTFTCSSNNVCCIGIPKKCKSADDKTTCGKDSAGTEISCKQFGKDFYCP